MKRIENLLNSIGISYRKITRTYDRGRGSGYYIHVSSGLPVWISPEDMQYSDTAISEYLKCIFDMDFNETLIGTH